MRLGQPLPFTDKDMEMSRDESAPRYTASQEQKGTPHVP